MLRDVWRCRKPTEGLADAASPPVDTPAEAARNQTVNKTSEVRTNDEDQQRPSRLLNDSKHLSPVGIYFAIHPACGLASSRQSRQSNGQGHDQFHCLLRFQGRLFCTVRQWILFYCRSNVFHSATGNIWLCLLPFQAIGFGALAVKVDQPEVGGPWVIWKTDSGYLMLLVCYLIQFSNIFTLFDGGTAKTRPWCPSSRCGGRLDVPIILNNYLRGQLVTGDATKTLRSTSGALWTLFLFVILESRAQLCDTKSGVNGCSLQGPQVRA